MIEFVLGVIGGAFLIFEIIFAALAVLSFSSFEKMHWNIHIQNIIIYLISLIYIKNYNLLILYYSVS